MDEKPELRILTIRAGSASMLLLSRWRICENMDLLAIRLDGARNDSHTGDHISGR